MLRSLLFIQDLADAFIERRANSQVAGQVFVPNLGGFASKFGHSDGHEQSVPDRDNGEATFGL
jgi:hypothetical protein